MPKFLYNGIELPVLPHWDETTYPYAVITYTEERTSLGVTVEEGYCLYVYGNPFYRTDNGFEAEMTGGLFYSWKTYSPNCSSWEGGNGSTTGSITIKDSKESMVWTNHDILNSDGTLYLAASEPVPIVQHVTESKGDGYALYNGVKLPNIDTVWTEELKKTHPYAGISPALQELYLLYIVDDIPTTGHNDTFGSTLALQAGTECKLYQLATTQEAADAFGISEANVWIWVKDMIAKEGDYICPIDSVSWASHDILNEDGTTYLAASAPIPLDGMNVIEWDGVTEGLVHTGELYKVAEYANASSAICVFSNGIVFTELVRPFESDSWVIGEASGGISEADLAETGLTESGIYMGAGNELYCSLLAYTPATTEPEEPEEPDTPPIPKVSPHLAFTIGKQLGRRIFR